MNDSTSETSRSAPGGGDPADDPSPPLAAVFDGLPDPRRETRNEPHRPTDILAIATCAVIGGAESWGAVAGYGRTKEAFLRRFPPLDDGIASSDTFERVFARPDPAAFAAAFGRWMAAACEATGSIPIAIDGKSARPAKRATATGCLHVVRAWAAEGRLALGTASVADGSNEVAAIPELLRRLDLAGALVTIDAAGRQVENARIIPERRGRYPLAVEDNRPKLRAAVEAAGDRACEAELDEARRDGYEAVDDGHGRHEGRDVAVLYDPRGPPPGWPDAVGVVLVDGSREVGGKRTRQPSPPDELRGPGGRDRGIHPSPPGHRERAASGARCGLPRGSRPSPAGGRRSRPGDDPTGRGLAPEASTREGRRRDEASQGGLGRKLVQNQG